jgi:hypothetical protein
MLNEDVSKEEKLQDLDDQEREFLFWLCRLNLPFNKELRIIAKEYMFVSKGRLGSIQTEVYKKLEIKTQDPYKKRGLLKTEYCEIINRFKKFEDFKGWKWVPTETKKIEPSKLSQSQSFVEVLPPEIQPTKPELPQEIYEEHPVKIPPSVEPFTKEPILSQEPEPLRPPPQPLHQRPHTTITSRPIEEPLRDRPRTPWAFISALVILGIVIFLGLRYLIEIGIFEPIITPTEVFSARAIILNTYQTQSPTPRLTNTPRPTPTIYVTRPPSATQTPFSLPFEDNFTDQIRPEWVILGDIPYIKDGMLVTGKMIDDANFRGLTGMYVGDNSWEDLIIEAKIKFDCLNLGRKVGIGIRVGGIGNPMIFAPFRTCAGHLYSTTLTNDLMLSDTWPPQEPLSPDYDFHHWRTFINFVGVEQSELIYDIVLYATIKLSGNHVSMYFDVGTGIDVDLPPSYESGGVFIILDESVAYDYIKISPLP